ncbi:BQ5605_C009g05468 [Microbotryum silenes-dioicae]|uniref:BQ5605_C009g05468 protein n=1 Tax=Microbotryum silenes-dioicae TaxID=796604 RepID=A0A2X0N718_9BASI|nr:BQ5605_C009g05468 [Microbotryum silenes-dioicae]
MMETAWDRDLESASGRTQQLVFMYPQYMSERKVTEICSLFHALQAGVSPRSSKQT